MSEKESRRWVFEVLVKDENDFLGLIAYGLYKHKKHELALYYKSIGYDDNKITEELRKFQEQSLIGDRDIDGWRNNATSLFSTILENEKSQAINQFIHKIHSQEAPTKPFYLRLIFWLFSGVPSLFASFLLVALFLTIIAFTLPSKTISSATADFINKLANDNIVQPIELEPSKSNKK